MIRTKRVFEVICDQCTRALGVFEDDGCPWNFDSHEDAAAELAECKWVQAGDRVLCQQCVGRQGCELLGHTWGVWEPIENELYQGLRQRCERCTHTRLDPPPRRLREVVITPSFDDWLDDEMEG